MIKKVILSFFALLASCTELTVVPRFNTMSDAEIFEYNLGKPMLQRVICDHGYFTGSYIKTRRCMTIDQLLRHEMSKSLQLDAAIR